MSVRWVFSTGVAMFGQAVYDGLLGSSNEQKKHYFQFEIVRICILMPLLYFSPSLRQPTASRFAKSISMKCQKYFYIGCFLCCCIHTLPHLVVAKGNRNVTLAIGGFFMAAISWLHMIGIDSQSQVMKTIGKWHLVTTVVTALMFVRYDFIIVFHPAIIAGIIVTLDSTSSAPDQPVQQEKEG